MAAAILTLALTFLMSGGIWLLIGARLQLADDQRVNEVANLVAYFFASLPLVFVLVFFVVGASIY